MGVISSVFSLDGATAILQAGFGWIAYNRDNYADNVAMRQSQLYQEKNYHISWIAIARDDIRDIMQTSVGRFNNYMIVATLIFSVSAAALIEAEVPDEAESFIRHAFFASLTLSVVYFALSIMFCVKGGKDVFTNSMDLLTLELRPDHPDPYNFNYMKQCQQFEKSFRTAFRIPVLRPMYNLHSGLPPVKESLRKPVLSTLTSVEPGYRWRRRANAEVVAKFSERDTAWYFERFRAFQDLWRPYEDAAQDTLGHGIVALSHASAYYSLGKFHDSHEMWATFTLCLVYIYLSALLYYSAFDFGLHEEWWGRRHHVVTFAALVTGPACSALALRFSGTAARVLVPLSFSAHVLLAFLSFLRDHFQIRKVNESCYQACDFGHCESPSSTDEAQQHQPGSCGVETRSCAGDRREPRCGLNDFAAASWKAASGGKKEVSFREPLESPDLEGGLHATSAPPPTRPVDAVPKPLPRQLNRMSTSPHPGMGMTAAVPRPVRQRAPSESLQYDIEMETETDLSFRPRQDDECLLEQQVKSYESEMQYNLVLARGQSRIAHVVVGLTWLSLLLESIFSISVQHQRGGIEQQRELVKDILCSGCSRAEVVETLDMEWPSPFFRPRALACSMEHIFIADEFRIFEVISRSLIPTKCELHGTIADLAMFCDGAACHLLVLTGGPVVQVVNCTDQTPLQLMQLAQTPEKIAGGQGSVFVMAGGRLLEFQQSVSDEGFQPVWQVATVPREGLRKLNLVGDALHVFHDAEGGGSILEVQRLGESQVSRCWTLPQELSPILSGCMAENGTSALVLADSPAAPSFLGPQFARVSFS